MLLSIMYEFSNCLQVGDVVLVQEENCIQNEFKTIGLETLVCSAVSLLTTFEVRTNWLFWRKREDVADKL